MSSGRTLTNGLAKNLRLLEEKRQSGTLIMKLPRLPQIAGEGKAYISLVRGKVIDCFLEDRAGKHYPSHIEVLSRLDGDGTHQLLFYSSSSQPLEDTASQEQVRPAPPVSPSYSPTQRSGLSPRPQPPHQSSPRQMIISPASVLYQVNRPPFEQLRNSGRWGFRENMVLRMIFNMANGVRTLEEIQSKLAFSYDEVVWAVRTLYVMRAITLL